MQVGFFDLGDGNVPKEAKNNRNPKKGCNDCGRQYECDSPKMDFQGEGKSRILIVGEYPSYEDDKASSFFNGSGADYLWDMEKKLGVSFLEECWFVNNTRCFSPKQKVPTELEATNCGSLLVQTIKRLKPRIIISMGMQSTKSLILNRAKGRIGNNTSAKDFFSYQIPDQILRAWICPTYSPYFLTKIDNNQHEQRTFERDIRKAFDLIGTKLPVAPEDYEITFDPQLAISWIKEARKHKEVAFDYETTGIKPQKKGHSIVSASLCFGDKGYSFPFFVNSEFQKAWKRLMLSRRVGKIAHNLGFEHMWTYERAGKYHVKNWIWDTCLASHCLNNKGKNNLKFQTYIHFGVMGYDSGVDQFITKTLPYEDAQSTNSINRIEEAPKEELLTYGALDALYTFQLKQRQAKLFPKVEHLEGLDLLVQGAATLAKIQCNGMCYNEELANESKIKLDSELKDLEAKIMNSDELKGFPGTFNINSNPQLSNLLYKKLGYKKPDGSATDEKALSNIGTDFVKDILEFRKLSKIKNTYLAQFDREVVNGKIHPFFNLNTVETFRSSSNAPNFQNIPKRDKRAKEIVRRTLKPRPGNRMIEYDYSGVEVTVGSCYHKDPKMIDYLLHPEKNNMHTDTAIDLFYRTHETFTKDERFCAKNGMVFPAFYGSSGPEMAKNIWAMITPETREHLASKGIKTFRKFEKHVCDIEDVFWNERFKVYKNWKWDTWRDYKRKGFIESYTGFRLQGPMKMTEACNYQIQGTAFHCLLWTVTKVTDLIQNISGRSFVIGQIHDAVVVDAHPEDEPEIDKIIQEWGTQKIKERFPWLIVPLTMEKEYSEIDGNWAEMKE